MDEERSPDGAVVPAAPFADGSTPPRLRPRPLDRPAVDAESAAAFARPARVPGAFAAATPERAAVPAAPAPPPPAALALAFGRPVGGSETLQRPPGRGSALPAGPPPLWGRADDPWRDPR